MGWKPASGHGTLITFAVARHAVHPCLADDVPYTITLVELQEGVRMVSSIPKGMEVDLRTGMQLRCKVVKYDDKFALPYFIPVDSIK